ncbi:MAG: molecular chaperone TorD family protein [Eggerthellaceae bacterium]|nr:molecular chaperone TorD family protein [Eggerthellaceae bacterium]
MEKAELVELVEPMEQRAAIYALLSRLFIKEVDDDLFNALKTEPPFEITTGNRGIFQGAELMEEYLESEDASTLDLAKDYAKSFCGASSTQKTAAYPYESVYTSEDGILMQDARDAVMVWYGKYGVIKNKDFHDCEDHVGLILEFYSYMITQFVNAVKEDDVDRANEILEDQQKFMHEHLINWIPDFAHHVNMRARTDFYQGLGQVLLNYVRQDRTALDNVLQDESSDDEE